MENDGKITFEKRDESVIDMYERVIKKLEQVEIDERLKLYYQNLLDRITKDEQNNKNKIK